MVAGRQSIKYIFPTTFSPADSGGFEKPPLRKHRPLYARRENVRGKFSVWLQTSVSAESSDIYLSESNDILTPDKPRFAPVWQIKSREARKFFLNFWQIGDGFFKFLPQKKLVDRQIYTWKQKRQ